MTKKKSESEIKFCNFGKCPRCGSKKIKTASLKQNGLYSKKTVTCNACNLSITAADIWYLRRVWNSNREILIDHCFRDLKRAPWTAYVNNDVAAIWGGGSKLVEYIEAITGYEIVIKTAKNVGNGIILNRIG
jgi:hypothetical protein